LPKSNNVVAVVTVFRPDEDVFRSLDAIKIVCPTVIVVDDGSSAQYTEILSRIEGVVSDVVRQKANLGLAEALNVGIRRAAERFDATHVLTFDQDTQPDPDYLDRALESLQNARDAGLDVAVVCAGINNEWTLQDTLRVRGVNTAVEALQSGFLVPMSTIERIGDFQSGLFIDCVDIEYMFRARRHGMHTVIAESARIAHTVGDRIAVTFRGRQVHVLGKRLEFSFHGPLRRYYITRNRLILFKEYAPQHRSWAVRHFLNETKIAVLCFLFGRDRPQQLFALVAGIADGIVGRDGRIPAPTARLVRPRKAPQK
jgi:rhamnosyltransferase